MYKVITHPIFSNIGGILQAFALQHAVRGLGKECKTIDYLPIIDCPKYEKKPGLLKKLKFWFTMKRLKWGIPGVRFPWYLFPQVSVPFKQRHMHTWALDNKRRNLKALADGSPFIVGSDQVWRGKYARLMQSVPFFFLDFATQSQRQRSIAYAASFGSDTWEGTPEETAVCAQLLRDFKAVSVREHSGIQICQEVFGVEAVQIPDPTLLLDAEEYSRVIQEWKTDEVTAPYVASYLLDTTNQLEELVRTVARQAGLQWQCIPQPKQALKVPNLYPITVPQWLKYIRDSEFVVTDSFHGCVFSIMFNKPFVCLGNEARGTARFDSLLGAFKLQERILVNPNADSLLETLRKPINWAEVNALREAEKARGIAFLKEHL